MVHMQVQKGVSISPSTGVQMLSLNEFTYVFLL